MQRNTLQLMILLLLIFFLNHSPSFSVEYPIISIGFNGGYGQGELNKGLMGRIFLRYSLEAYIPGFQIEVGYIASFYQALQDSVIFNPDQLTEKRTITTHVSDNYPTISGAVHLRPFGEMTTIYFGGGLQIHFLTSHRKTKDRYWDAIGEKYQQVEVANVVLLDQTRPGCHIMGGLRFALGQFGSFDMEVRQTFLKVHPEDWEEQTSAERYGPKSWNNFSVNMGLTIYIF